MQKGAGNRAFLLSGTLAASTDGAAPGQSSIARTCTSTWICSPGWLRVRV